MAIMKSLYTILLSTLFISLLAQPLKVYDLRAVSYTHLRAHETVLDIVSRLLLEKKKHHT